MEEKLKLLEKPYWYPKDIEKYLEVSASQANYISIFVKDKFGVPAFFEGKERQAVSSDKVLEFLGGKDRLYEVEILTKKLETIKVIKELERGSA